MSEFHKGTIITLLDGGSGELCRDSVFFYAFSATTGLHVGDEVWFVDAVVTRRPTAIRITKVQDKER